MLSKEVQKRLETAREAAGEYRPKHSVARQLGERTLIMLVGPPATGKTSVIEKMVELDPNFSQVSIFSTRDPRPDDNPDMFRLLPHDDESVTELLDHIELGRAVQYAVHPTQDRIYGTDPEDYRSEYNLLATLSGAVDQFRQLPFKSTHTIGLTAEPAIWAGWFNARYPAAAPDRQKRLEEAILSLDWQLDTKRRASIAFVKNIEGDPSAAAQEIINTVRTGEIDTGSDAMSQAYGMRVWARGALGKTISEDRSV